MVNGVAAGEVEIDGIATAVLEGTLPAGVLRDAGNTLELGYESPGPEEGLGMLYLDALDLGVAVAPSRDAVRRCESFPTTRSCPRVPSTT